MLEHGDHHPLQAPSHGKQDSEQPEAEAQPLSGKRILITRPAGQGSGTARLVRLRGAEPVEFPIIAIGAPPDPAALAKLVRRLDPFDCIVFTSENAVSRFYPEIEALGWNARILDRFRIAAIGRGTAEALVSFGIHVDILPGEFIGESLAQAILDDATVRALLLHGRPRVLILRALAAREVVPERLREAGCIVETIPVYATLPASTARRGELISMLESQTIDCVMLTSSSIANGLADLLGTRAEVILQGVMVASIGPITTAAAERRGLTVGLTAVESTVAGLLLELETHFANNPGDG